jgi:hypothetical protein
MNGKSLLFLTVLLIVTLGSYAKDKVNQLTTKEQKENWELLFDGKSTSKWRSESGDAFPEKGWEVIDECLVSKGGGNILSKEAFGNFEFVWDWKMETVGGNSGIKYYVNEYQNSNLGKYLGIEYQMLDDGEMSPTSIHALGAVYELYPPSADKRVKPVGQWNQSRVISKGTHVEHWLNGAKVAEYERGSADLKEKVAKSKFNKLDQFGQQPQGMLMLTDHGAVVYFKNLKIRKL